MNNFKSNLKLLAIHIFIYYLISTRKHFNYYNICYDVFVECQHVKMAIVVSLCTSGKYIGDTCIQYYSLSSK